MDHLEETELVRQSRQGSTGAFERLYEKYNNHVYRFLYHLTNGAMCTEDLFQETWLRAARYVRNGKKVEHFKSWLFTIAVNLFRDEMRKKRTNRLVFGLFATREDETAARRKMVPKFVAADFGQSYDIRQALSGALEKLTEKQRTVFILTYVEGFKIRQVSDMLNISQGTVKSLLFRTVRKLRKELKDFNNNV